MAPRSSSTQTHSSKSTRRARKSPGPKSIATRMAKTLGSVGDSIGEVVGEAVGGAKNAVRSLKIGRAHV